MLHGILVATYMSKFAWTVNDLDTLKPIFEAEILVDGQETGHVYLQWDSESRPNAWRNLRGYHAPLAVVTQTSDGHYIQWQAPMELPPNFHEFVTPSVTQTSPAATLGRFIASFGEFQAPMRLPVRIATEEMSQTVTLTVTLTRLVRCDGIDVPLQ